MASIPSTARALRPSSQLSAINPRINAPTFVEWREGTSPSRSRRTVRDSRPSYGSHRPASGNRNQLPVSEQRGLPVFHDGQRLIRLTRLVSKSLVFVHDPSNEMLVDAPRQGEQLGVIEDPVIVDPASHLGIDGLRDAGQVRARAAVEVPAPDLLALRLLRLVADGRKKVHKEPVPSTSQAAPEGIAEEVETGVLRLPGPVRVLAVHNLRLRRVQLQTQRPEPVGDGSPQFVGPRLGSAVGDHVVRVTFERAVRVFPDHPHVERVMHKQVGQQR